MTYKSPWDILEIKKSADKNEIRKAYARLLKSKNPEDDPEGFKILREAYEQAIKSAAGKTKKVSNLKTDINTINLTPVVDHDIQPDKDSFVKLDALIKKLASMLKNENVLDNSEILMVFDQIINHPSFEHLDRRADYERKIGSIINKNLPRSDVLIEKAVSIFNWKESLSHRKIDSQIRLVLQRKDDILYRKYHLEVKNDESKAFEILKKEPKAPSFWQRLTKPILGGEIRSVLNTIRQSHDTLLYDIHPKSEEFWSEYFQKPRLPDWSLWSFLIGPFWILFTYQLFVIDIGRFSQFLFFSALPVGFMIAGLFVCFGNLVPQALFRKHFDYYRPTWLLLGAFPIAFLALVLSAIPFAKELQLFQLILISIIAFFGLVWSFNVKDAQSRFNEIDVGTLGLFVSDFAIFFWWLFVAYKFPLIQAFGVSIALFSGVLTVFWLRNNFSDNIYYMGHFSKLVLSIIPPILGGIALYIQFSTLPITANQMLIVTTILLGCAHLISRMQLVYSTILFDSWGLRILLFYNFISFPVGFHFNITPGTGFYLTMSIILYILIILRSIQQLRTNYS